MMPADPMSMLASLEALDATIKHLCEEQQRLSREAAKAIRSIPDFEVVCLYRPTGEEATIYGASLVRLDEKWTLHYLVKLPDERFINLPAEHIHRINPSNP